MSTLFTRLFVGLVVVVIIVAAGALLCDLWRLWFR